MLIISKSDYNNPLLMVMDLFLPSVRSLIRTVNPKLSLARCPSLCIIIRRVLTFSYYYFHVVLDK